MIWQPSRLAALFPGLFTLWPRSVHNPRNCIQLGVAPRLSSWIFFSQVLVGEPSVIDTIQILRGLKDKYESHHGVRIHDRCARGKEGCCISCPDLDPDPPCINGRCVCLGGERTED